MDHPFEDVEIKINAPDLLEKRLASKRIKCMIGTGAMSDPYIPIEESLKITRSCFEIIERYGFGLSVQTKSSLILRDLDLLISINQKAKCVVAMTLTTFDENLCKVVEPNVCGTKERFETLKALRNNGINTVVWLSPILPFINDNEENLLGILNYCIEAGVYGILCFGMGMTLREGDREYYYEKLDLHFPGLKEKYERTYGNSYEIPSPHNNELMKTFREICIRSNIVYDTNSVFSFMHTLDDNAKEKKSDNQPELF